MVGAISKAPFLLFLLLSHGLHAQRPQEDAGGAWLKKKDLSIYQGEKKKKSYYEGWYYKVVDAEKDLAFAIIPGIAKSADPSQSHSFIQFIHHTKGAHYFRFPSDSFRFNPERFEVRIADNYFSKDSVRVKLGSKEIDIDVALSFSEQVSWPFDKPIMGPYSAVPIMETYHEVVALNQKVEGSVHLNQYKTALRNASGYVEKDWGSSFPSSYVWMQCNDFEEDSVSFMCSIARIPFLTGTFTGYLGFIQLRDSVYRFATYTDSKVKDLNIDSSSVSFAIVHPNLFRLEVNAFQEKAFSLAAPSEGEMQRRISEGLGAQIELKLFSPSGELLFKGKGDPAGLEIVGDYTSLLRRLK